jgi:hypothetical protein
MGVGHVAGLNRKPRKELARRLRVEDPGLAVRPPNAAGIDVGNRAHYVAVRPDRDPDSVRRFDCFTADVHRLADWLRHCGRIDGIDVGVAQTVISEVGFDMTRWKTEAHFASWLGLCPDNRITGGKVIRKGTRHVVNRAATALRLAATTLLRSQSYLGAQYRRLRGKLGAPKAITAMAHKLARLVYRMLKWGREYVDKGLQYYEERHRQQQVHLLKKRAAKLGLQIVGPEAA